MLKWFSLVVVLAGCTAAVEAASPEEPPPTDEGSYVVDAVDSAQRPEAGSASDAGARVRPSSDASVGSSLDATPPADANPPPPVDAAAPVDAGAKPDGGTDAGLCLDYLTLPTSPYWRGTANYDLGCVEVSGSVTCRSISKGFQCPSVVEGNSCKYAIMARWTRPTPEGWVPNPPACHLAVPEKCLPCTGGQTEW